MKTFAKMVVVSISLIVAVNCAFAVNDEVVVKVHGKEVTKLQATKGWAGDNPDHFPNKGGMQSALEQLIDDILIREYISRNKIEIPREKIVQELTKSAEHNGYSDLQKYFEERTIEPKGMKLEDRQSYKRIHDGLLAYKVLETFDPNIFHPVTNQEVQEYITKSYGSDYIGNGEAIKTQEIDILLPEGLTAEAREAKIKKIEAIYKEIKAGGDFDVIYKRCKKDSELIAETTPDWMLAEFVPSEYIAGFTSWEQLKGKIVLFRHERLIRIIKVIDYLPSDMIAVNKASPERLREEFGPYIMASRQGIAKRRLLEKLRADAVAQSQLEYVGMTEMEWCQKLSDDYKTWWVDTYKNDPNFQERYDRIKAQEAREAEAAERRPAEIKYWQQKQKEQQEQNKVK